MGDFEGRLADAYKAKLLPDLTITRARNGYILTMPSEGTSEVVEARDIDGTIALLWAIVEHLGLPEGHKYAARRLDIGTKPGHKHHDYHPQPCAECECGCDPDQSTPEDES